MEENIIKDHVLLIGPVGSGKTTKLREAVALSQSLGLATIKISINKGYSKRVSYNVRGLCDVADFQQKAQ